MDTRIGIWLDKEKAHIITLTENGEQKEIIESNAEFRERYEGEKGTSGRFGDQYVNQERKKEERIKHQLSSYYKNIESRIKEADELYIFGPSEAKNELRKNLETNIDISSRIKAIDTADSMTDNQIIAKVREFFED